MKHPKPSIQEQRGGDSVTRRTGDGPRAVTPSRRLAVSSLCAWRRAFGFVVAALLWPAAVLHAQSYSIDWFTVGGGGGTSADAQYSLTGTPGQPEAGGPMAGGSFSLTGGFWSAVSVEPTVEAPRLAAANSGPNAVVVSWSDSSGRWILEQSPSLSSPSWTDCPLSPVVEGGRCRVTVSPPTGTLFFRLVPRQP
ncbi:MAG: hypothetical protein HZA90_13600 [Verrucomicrobia bacterium]|nr:hypothetical protein [Verrucomicrobiota bacterium]